MEAVEVGDALQAEEVVMVAAVVAVAVGVVAVVEVS